MLVAGVRRVGVRLCGTLLQAFEGMNKQPEDERLVTDWGISQTTLEDVFMEVNRPFEQPVVMPSGPGSPAHDPSSPQPQGPPLPLLRVPWQRGGSHSVCMWSAGLLSSAAGVPELGQLQRARDCAWACAWA